MGSCSQTIDCVSFSLIAPAASPRLRRGTPSDLLPSPSRASYWSGRHVIICPCFLKSVRQQAVALSAVTAPRGDNHNRLRASSAVSGVCSGQKSLHWLKCNNKLKNGSQLGLSVSAAAYPATPCSGHYSARLSVSSHMTISQTAYDLLIITVRLGFPRCVCVSHRLAGSCGSSQIESNSDEAPVAYAA